MYKFKKSAFLLLALILINISLTSAFQVQFNSPKAEYFNITITNNSILDFEFSLTGEVLNASYPSNISLDIGNDGLIDWEFKLSSDIFKELNVNCIF